MNKFILAVATLVLLAGCATEPKQSSPTAVVPPSIMNAYYTATPITVDGRLDDPIWQHATVYPLNIPVETDVKDGKHLLEPGTARLAWDNKNFYVGIEFMDSDIVAEGTTNQLPDYALGDVVEVFLKPAGNTYYWELYLTPAGKQTWYFWPSRGHLLPSGTTDYVRLMNVAAQVTGTLNNWHDRDTKWTGELAIPIQYLKENGDAFGPGSDWTILVARYNYSRYLSGVEYSSAPRLPKTNYHLWEDYATIRWIK